MALQIYTSTVYWYKNQPDMLDISLKSGDHRFAPTSKLLREWLDNGHTYEDQCRYAREYIELMRKSRSNNLQHWKELLQRERVVLLCYCKPMEFCHRLLLSAILVKCGAEYKGEITKEGQIRHSPMDEVVRWAHFYGYENVGYVDKTVKLL